MAIAPSRNTVATASFAPPPGGRPSLDGSCGLILELAGVEREDGALRVLEDPDLRDPDVERSRHDVAAQLLRLCQAGVEIVCSEVHEPVRRRGVVARRAYPAGGAV